MPQKNNRVTIAQVAEYAQVSMMTVSRVVNNHGQVSAETRELVSNAMRELGYKPNRIARSLVNNKTYKIGVIVPDLSSMFFTAILASIEHVLWQHDFYMVLSNTGKSNRREQDILDVFEEDQVDGVLVFGSHLSCEQLTKLLQNQRAAVVFNGDVDPKVAGQILVDQRGAINTAVKHLYDVGCKHLAYVGVDRRTYAMRERQFAFEDAVAEMSNLGDSWIIDTYTNNIDTQIQEHLSNYPQTDGLICFNDELAVEVLFSLAQMGKRVPEDIAVIGFDDVKIARFITPQLTTIRLKTSINELGKLAANMLLERMEGKADDQPVILSHELVIRDSAPLRERS